MGVYTQAKLRIANGKFSWVNDNVRALLVAATYTYNFVHTKVSDILAHEVSGGTYARVDITLRELRVDTLGDRVLFWAPQAVFPLLSGVTPAGIVLYEEKGPDASTPSDDWLIAHLDFGGPVISSGLDFLVSFDSDGVFALKDC